MRLLSKISRYFKPNRRLRPTREGVWFVLLSLAIGFAAINTGNNLLYLVMAMMLSFIIISGVLSEISLRKVGVERSFPSHLFALTPFEARVTVANNKRFFPSYSLLVPARPPTKSGGAGGKEPNQEKGCYFVKVPPKTRSTLSYPFVFESRGLKPLSGLILSTRYPFGLFVKWLTIPSREEVLVYPYVADLKQEPARAANLLGHLPTFEKGPGSEFHGLRDYIEGEDLRLVHWKTSARAGRLMIREWEREGLNQVALILDNLLPEGEGNAFALRLEKAVSLAASLAFYFIEENYYVRLLTRSDQTPWGRGPDHLWTILELLALLSATKDEGGFNGLLPELVSDSLPFYFQPGERATPAWPSSIIFGPAQLDSLEIFDA